MVQTTTERPYPYSKLDSDLGTFYGLAYRTKIELDETTPATEILGTTLRINLALSGSTRVQSTGERQSSVFKEDDVVILPPGATWAGHWRGQTTCIGLEIATELLHQYASNPIRYPNDGYPIVIRDARLRKLLLALHPMQDTRRIADELFTQHVARIVVRYYLRRYCGVKVNRARALRGLSRQQIGLISTFIESRLAQKMTLDELSSTVRLNSSVLCRRFKCSTGMSPYQYVLHARIEMAKHLLSENRGKLSDLALTLGFYDQSQFTNQFRRMVGLPPSKYQG